MHVASISDATLFRREISANCGIFTRVTGSSDVLIYRDTHTEIPRPNKPEKNYLHYCHRNTAIGNWFLRPAGYDFETDRKLDKWLNGKALIRKAREAEHIHYCQLGKMDVLG